MPVTALANVLTSISDSLIIFPQAQLEMQIKYRKSKTKDSAERKKFARWANLAKETACRGGKRQKLRIRLLAETKS
jgi:hypothetical protein